jgi:hypothetical protein
VVVDGTLIHIDRVAADRPFYSGKHKRHGMNLQVIASPGRQPPAGLRCLHGSVHDKEAEWTWGVIAELEKVGIITPADKGHRGQDPLQGQEQARIAERGQPRPREVRGPGERANAQVKAWRILRKLRCRCQPKVCSPRHNDNGST